MNFFSRSLAVAFGAFLMWPNAGLSQGSSRQGLPTIQDHWRFSCEAKPFNKNRFAKLKQEAQTAPATLQGAVSQLNYACVLSQYELDQFDKKVQQFRDQGSKGQPPALDQKGSTDLVKQTLSTLAAVYKSARKNPDALYYYGYVLTLSNHPLAVNVLDELQTGLPNATKTSPSYLVLGEYYFGKQDYEKALREYQRALKSKDDAVKNYTSYKVAWTHYVQAAQKKNAAGQQKSITDLINISKETAESDTPLVKHLSEIIKGDIVDLLADMGNLDYAKRILTETNQKNVYSSLVEKFAIAKLQNKDPNGAYRLLASIIKDNPLGPDNPRLIGTMIEISAQTQNAPLMVKNLKFITTAYLAKEAKWYIAQKPAVQKKTEQSMEQLFYDAATTLDQQGRTNHNAVYLDNAVQAYDLYAKTFPDSKRLSEVLFYYGQLEYERKQYLNSAKQLLAMLKKDSKGKATKDAAELMVTAAQYAVNNDKTQYNLPKPGTIKSPMTIPPIKKTFADTLDFFAALFPKNENSPAMTYTAASVYYDFGNYDEAIKRYTKYIKANPNTPFAKEGAIRILAYYKLKKDDDGLAQAKDMIAKIPPLRNAPEIAAYYNAGQKSPGAAATDKASPTKAPAAATAKTADGEKPTPEAKAVEKKKPKKPKQEEQNQNDNMSLD